MMDQIKEFQEKFGAGYDGRPRVMPRELQLLRDRLISEEAYEYISAATLEDRLDALVDLVYVALGNAYLHGFNFEEAFKRVHEANMKKVRATHPSASPRNSIFDVVKPEGWTPPYLGDLV